MRSIKIYLGVVTVLLLGALGFGVYVWYMVQKLQNPSALAPTEVTDVSQKTEVE